jgi:hypothetical protein
MDIANRTLSGHYRLYGTSKKFRVSVAWTIPLPDARIEAQTDWIVQRLVTLDPRLAGTRVVEEVEQPDQDVP